MAMAVTAMVVAATAALFVPAVANAEPVVPQPDTPCAEKIAGALTKLPDYKTVLECRNHRWQTFDSPFPNSDRWLSYGPELTLSGEGMRNREIDSGDWIAYPQDSASQCKAEQVVVVSAGKVGPPQVSTGESGQPLELRVMPLLFNIELSGNCLWQKVE